MNVAALERRLVALEARRPARQAPLTAIEVARAAGIEPDPWQAAVLGSDARQVIMACSRQSGKSTTAAVLAAQQAVTVPGSLILLVAPALRQSMELFRKLKHIYAALDGLAPPRVETTLALELANRSRIVCLPGQERTLRGYSAPALIIEDEAARVPDELHYALRPMLAASRGRMVLLSSPFGQRGHFWEVWEHADHMGWERVMVTAHDVPRIDRVWLAQERAAIGEWWFSQEYLCQFREAVDAYFDPATIDAAFSADGIEPLFPITEVVVGDAPPDVNGLAEPGGFWDA